MPRLNERKRRLVRAALRMHDQLAGPRSKTRLPPLPAEAWEDVRHMVQRYEQAITRGWRAAAQQMLEDLDDAAGRLKRELESFHQGLPSAVAPKRLASPSDLVADLEALASEFGDVAVDLQVLTVSVQTEPIKLEDVALGSFQIVLHWDRIGPVRAYEIIAIEPHPAEGNEEITHPHVRDEQLCEGEGASPIRVALAEGRLLDFFMLVNQILQTYNAESAHILLELWQGVSCRNCGWRMPSDESGTCERCDEPLCHDCSTSCSGCERLVCGTCLEECASCGDFYCQSCLTAQPGTDRQLCETCFHQHQEEEENHDQSPDHPAVAPTQQAAAVAANTAAPADPLCLGETAVPA